MSSKIDPLKQNRTIKKSYPKKIKNLMSALEKTFGNIQVVGSYKDMNWAKDSDFDVAIKDFNLNEWRSYIDYLSERYKIKIDTGFRYNPEK